ncbi:hypothetical protein MRX96_029622 [Rhipicephalus microplus]
MAGHAQECVVSALKRRVFAVATDGLDSQAQLYPVVATFFAEESGIIESKMLTLSTLEGSSTGRNIAKFIMRHYGHTVNGKEVHTPRDVPALKESAIPTIFLNLPKYMMKTLPKERKRRMGQGSSVPAKKSREDIDDSEHESVQLIPHDELDVVNDEVPQKDFIFGLRLPSEYWPHQTFQNRKHSELPSS